MGTNIDDALKTFYKEKENYETIHRLIPNENGELLSLSTENCYINLSIVQHIETDSNAAAHRKPSKEQMEYGDLKQSFNRPRSSEELNLEETEENYYQIEDLFDSNGDASRRIFMLGRAGIGKTTLCKKIVYEHYVNGLWKDKFNRIIWIPLRTFNGKSMENLEAPSLGDVFFVHYFSSEGNKDIGQELVKENEADENKVLYLLDGLDEIQNIVGNKKSLFNQILDCLWCKPFVIVTSRPYTFHDNFSRFDVILETIGFSQENILDYVQIVCNDPSDFQKQKEIIEFIDKSPANIAGIVSIPIFLDIICYTWTDIKAMAQNTQITMTRLYSILEKCLWGQFISRMERDEVWRNTVKTKSEIYKSVDVYMLAKVAYTMLTQNQIEFTSTEALTEHGFSAEDRILLKNTHFLNCLSPVDENIEVSKTYIFAHLTLQEYLAAVYLVKCFKDNRHEFEKAIYHKYNPRYYLVWSFVAGILSDSKNDLGYINDKFLMDTFFNFLERDPVDELGIAHQYLIVTCLNESSYPSLLDSERENRLLNELLSYIFTQYVAGGKSLFKQQLPVKVLQKFFSTPDKYWDLDSKWFTTAVLKEQFLPEEIVTSILDGMESAMPDICSETNEALKLRYQRQTNEAMLRRQSHLDLAAIQIISKRIDSQLASNRQDSKMIEKYLNILDRKVFLPYDEDSLRTIKNLISYARSKSKEIKNQIVKICLNLKEIPFEIIEELVLTFQKVKKQRNITDEQCKNDILMRIVKDKVSFSAEQMMQLVKQKCFSTILEEFLKTKICKNNIEILYRLLLIAARRNLENDLIEQLIELVKTPDTPFQVRRLLLYVIGNMKTLPEEVARNLIATLEQQNLIINPIFSNTLMYTKCSMTESIAMDFRYLSSIVPLMKCEFYEAYQKKRSIVNFKQRRHLSNHQYDLKYFNFLSKDIEATIKHSMKKGGYTRMDFHVELQRLATQDEWITEFETDDVHRFVRKFGFGDWYLLKEGHKSAKYYMQFFGKFLGDEWSLDSKLFHAILAKYRPLVVLAHDLYNKSPARDREQATFQTTCERQLLESLIIRALRDSEISKDLLLNLETKFSEQINTYMQARTGPMDNRVLPDVPFGFLEQFESNLAPLEQLTPILPDTPFGSQSEPTYIYHSDGNRLSRLTLNYAKILEFRKLETATVGQIIDLIPIGNEYEMELTLSLLHVQTITEREDVEKLKAYLLSDDTVMQRKCHFVANIFENNSRLLKSVQHSLLLEFRNSTFYVKLKLLQALHNSEIEDEQILLELPDMLNVSRQADNWIRCVELCVATLLNQKKLPSTVLEKMAVHFDNMESQYIDIYLGFLNLLRGPLPQKCIESLYEAISTGFISNTIELAKNSTESTESEILMLKILRKQPLWNLIESDCDFKFKDVRGEMRYTIKEKVIAEKILQDKMPMAILKADGKQLCCFSPNLLGDYPLLEFGALNIVDLLKSMFQVTGVDLNLPNPLDRITRYLKFHNPQENLKYIRQLHSQLGEHTSVANVKFQIDSENFYIKVNKANPKVSAKALIDLLKSKFESDEYRHVDLSKSDLEDRDIFELAFNFLEPFSEKASKFKTKQLTTLILSDNKISVTGLSELLRQFKKSHVDFIFLDRNLIFFSVNQYKEYIDSNYPSLPQLGILNPKLNVQLLDLSLNFISNGKSIAGDPYADKEIPTEEKDNLKNSIQNTIQIHSQNLDHEIFKNDIEFGQIRSYCHSLCYTDEKMYTTLTGCVMVAEERPRGLIGRWLYNRGHAFMVIEWIPDSEYGQRQLILAHLRKKVQDSNRLTIEIIKKSPHELMEKLKKCLTPGRVFVVSNDMIKDKLIPRLHEHRKQVDVFDYYILSSRVDRERRGRFNCITWTDEMLKSLEIPSDSMHKSRTRLYGIISVVAFLFCVLFYFLFLLFKSLAI